VIVAAALVGMTVLPVKYLTERAAPSSALPPEQGVPLFATLPPGEYDTSYPAGHVVNSVVWYGVVLLFVTALVRAREPARAWRPAPWLWAVARVGPVVLILATTTYLSFHWLTDGLAGLCLGLLIERVLRWSERLYA
jgi:membrane-associated phospholipid phosphatase